MAVSVRRLHVVATVGLLATAVALVWGGWTAWLWVMASEGSVPPSWRGPDLPAGAAIVSEDEECGSGGCARVTVLSPSSDQTPEALVAELGLTEPQRHGWHVLDPHPVQASASVEGDKVRLLLSYTASN